MMKKIYSTPRISFESFTLSTNIAGDCEPPFVNNPSKDACGVPADYGPTLFTNTISDCVVFWDPNAALGNGLCYHNPSDTSNLFNS